MRQLKSATTVVASSPIDESEHDLVRRCIAGDAVAWRTLYDQHFAKVERLVSALGIADAEADDLCQEIFLLIYRYLPRFRGEARLSTWIHRLTNREAIRHAKKRRLRRTLAELFSREKRALAPPASPDGALGVRRHLHELLGRLSPERRLALVLYEIEGVPVSEIARISDCAESTIWTRLHRARGDLERMTEEPSS